jgi:hypothetical protein
MAGDEVTDNPKFYAYSRKMGNAPRFKPPTKKSRIEQLVEENKELTLQLLAASGQAADALDKLTKATEALKKLDRRNDSLDTFNSAVHEIVSAVLAELEGK